MTIADLPGEAAQLCDLAQLLGFENQIVISEALKFCESHIWSAPAERSADGALDFLIGVQFIEAIQSGVAASLCRRTPKLLSPAAERCEQHGNRID